jgi:dTDP-D-glucose 4,6-dehydratase
MAPYKFIERVSRGEVIQQYGDGSTSRDYTYISDIVDGVIRAIDTPLGYQIFNLGNGRPRLLKDFIALVEKCVGKPAIIEYLPEQPGDVAHTCANISKAMEMLGYSPKVSFEVGIEKTAAWYITACNEGLILNTDSTERESTHVIRRICSRIELDSNVQKATSQMKTRTERFLNEEEHPDDRDRRTELPPYKRSHSLG